MLPNPIDGESNLDRLPSMVRAYLDNAQAMIGRVPYRLRRLVVSVVDSPLAAMGLNQLWVPSTITRYCTLMTKLLTMMVRSRDSAPVDDEPFVNVLGICIQISEMRWRISSLTSEVDEKRTEMTKISIPSTRCCSTFVDRRPGASDVAARSPPHPVVQSRRVARMRSRERQGHTVQQTTEDHAPRGDGVGRRTLHPETRSDRSHGVHDRWSSRHHRHFTKPGRRIAPRSKSGDEKPIVAGTPDNLDRSGDSGG
ncbi:unnamed protein product [Sphagnum troendelagicum]|uniref:Uncharacterized protein n=1 Tax=Sphagnum troendelagicum TaxID=128251 RepID=A0ABP0TJL1_9BRYO